MWLDGWLGGSHPARYQSLWVQLSVREAGSRERICLFSALEKTTKCNETCTVPETSRFLSCVWRIGFDK